MISDESSLKHVMPLHKDEEEKSGVGGMSRFIYFLVLGRVTPDYVQAPYNLKVVIIFKGVIDGFKNF